VKDEGVRLVGREGVVGRMWERRYRWGVMKRWWLRVEEVRRKARLR